MEEQLIRIDGREYVAGSPEAVIAQERFDAICNEVFAHDHPELVERNVRIIRQTDLLERVRTDANATAALARDLVYVTAEIQRKIYARTRMFEFVRPDTSHPRGAESYERRMVDRTGKARVSHTLAGDSPRAEVKHTGEMLPYRFVRASYAYTLDDLERAAFARVPLPALKREACVEMIARELDRIGREGTVNDPEGDSKLRGFFNNPYVNVHTLTNGEWPTATAAEIIADWQEVESAIIAAGLDEQPQLYQWILPSASEARLLTHNAGKSTPDTVGQYLLRNSRLIKRIGRYVALDSAVSPAIAAADAPMGIVVPIDQQEAGLEWPMPISYEEQPPEVRGYEWIVQARARCGGVEFLRPFFCLYTQNHD
jgi:hypothetical protein